MSDDDPPGRRTPPSIAQHVAWSLALVLASVVLALLATPILRWLGFR